MKTKLIWIRRRGYAAIALALTAAIGLPVLTSTAFAASQITSRSIQMSSSLLSNPNTSYNVSFKPATSASVQAIIVDFCDNDPLVDDTTCSLPAGFTITATPAVNNQSSVAGCNLSTFTTVGQLNTDRTLELSAASPVALTAGASCGFTITTVTNPSTANHSFYARIYTFDTTTHANSYSPGVQTNVIDDGGVALSTSTVINITAKVMETLAFCVYNDMHGGVAGTGTCGVDDPSITIGHASGSATIIDSSAIDTALDDFSLSTNAQSGAVVTLKGDTLKSGSNQINPAGAAAVAFVAGTEDFGVRVSTSGTSITPQAPYNGAAGSYGLDVTSTPNITSTYGQPLANLTAPANNSISKITWAATASNTTKAGTYTAAEQLIATGTF